MALSAWHAGSALAPAANGNARTVPYGGAALSDPVPSWWEHPFVLVAIALAVAIPILVPSFPLLIDLPAHFSGYYVQESLSSSLALSRFFELEWTFIPNLGVELLLVPLAPLLGVTGATRLIVALVPVLAVVGMLGIAREAHGRITPISLFALPLALSYPLTFGFVNYCLSVSLALLALALWLRLSRQGRTSLRSVVFAVIAACVMVTHVLGFGVLGLLIGGAALGAGFAAGRKPWEAAWHAVLACLPLAWPIVLLVFWKGGTAPSSGGWFDWNRYLIGLATILREQVRWWDVASALAVYAVASLPLLWRGRFAYDIVLLVPAALLWIVSLLLPSNVFGSDFVAVRLIPVACAMTILAIRPRAPLPGWVVLVALAFFVSRFAVSTVHMVEADTALQRELAALERVTKGSRVASFVVVPCERHWEPPRLQHIGSFATSRREAFSNDQFSRSEGHLLRLRYGDGSVIRPMPEAQVMSEPCARWNKPTLNEALKQLSWAHVDYLWLIDVPPGQVPPDPQLALRWQRGRSFLFEVNAAGSFAGRSDPATVL